MWIFQNLKKKNRFSEILKICGFFKSLKMCGYTFDSNQITKIIYK
eukprot:UN11472